MPAGLPCRPCDQRVCAPGDFRCLTSIRPAQVIEAADERWHAHAYEVPTSGGPTLTVRLIAGPDVRRYEITMSDVTDALALDARHRVDSNPLEQAGLVALFGVAGALQFSIAVAQILLTIAVVCWVALLVVRRERIEVPRVLLAAAGLRAR